MAVGHSKPRLFFLFILGLYSLLVIFVQSCNGSGDADRDLSPCGLGGTPSELDGLYWLLGSPTGANALCTVQGGQFKQVKVLEPDSRDPILLQDLTTEQIVLVERFSGRSARPSRASWFSPAGALLAQRGDWPQNAYSVMRTSSSQGLVTGFDFAHVWEFNWSDVEHFLIGQPTDFARTLNSINPLFTLKSGSWFAAIDGGFDLQRFRPTAARAFVFSSQTGEYAPIEKTIEDANLNFQCKNAFQFLLLSNSKAIVSCNPQYFGAVENENVGVFEIELTSTGELKVKNLLSKSAAEIQKIDLWGLDAAQKRIFVALKITTAEDYNGILASANWLSLVDSQLQAELRVAGPLYILPSGQSVFACLHDSQSCKQGELAVMKEPAADIRAIEPNFMLPFFAFPSRIPMP